MAKGCGKARKGLTRGKIAGAKYMTLGGSVDGPNPSNAGSMSSGYGGSRTTGGGNVSAGSNVGGGGRQGGTNNVTSSAARAGQISNPAATAARLGDLPAQAARAAGVSADTANSIGNSLARGGFGSMSMSGSISGAAKQDMARADDFRRSLDEVVTRPTITVTTQTPVGAKLTALKNQYVGQQIPLSQATTLAAQVKALAPGATAFTTNSSTYPAPANIQNYNVTPGFQVSSILGPYNVSVAIPKSVAMTQQSQYPTPQPRPSTPSPSVVAGSGDVGFRAPPSPSGGLVAGAGDTGFRAPPKSQDRLVSLDAAGNIVEAGSVPTHFGKQFYDRLPQEETPPSRPAQIAGAGDTGFRAPPTSPTSPSVVAASSPPSQTGYNFGPGTGGFMGRNDREDRTARDGQIYKKRNPYQPGTTEYDQWNKDFNSANNGTVAPTMTLSSTAKSGGLVRRDGVIRRGRTKGRFI